VVTKLGAEETLAQHAAVIVARLEDSEWVVRKAAVQTLGKLDLADLAQHEQAIAKAAKEDKNTEVQDAARVVMHKLEPAAGHTDAVVARLEDSDCDVREAAVETLGKLEPAALAQHGAALAARLEDSNDDVRKAAVETLGKLDLAALAQHQQALAKVAEEDKDSDVRRAAAVVLATL